MQGNRRLAYAEIPFHQIHPVDGKAATQAVVKTLYPGGGPGKVFVGMRGHAWSRLLWLQNVEPGRAPDRAMEMQKEYRGGKEGAEREWVLPLCVATRSLVLGNLFGHGGAGQGTVAATPRMVRDGDQDLADVVRIVGLCEVVAQPGGRVQRPAGIVAVPLERRIGGDADDVIPRRDDRRVVAAVER